MVRVDGLERHKKELRLEVIISKILLSNCFYYLDVKTSLIDDTTQYWS